MSSEFKENHFPPINVIRRSENAEDENIADQYRPHAMKISYFSYVVSVPSSLQKKKFSSSNKEVLQNYLSSNIILILLDFKDASKSRDKKNKILETLEGFMDRCGVSEGLFNRIFIVPRPEGEKSREAFLPNVDKALPFILQKLDDNDSDHGRGRNYLTLFHVCDDFESRAGFKSGEYKNLEERVFHSNFVFLKGDNNNDDFEKKQKDMEKGYGGEEEKVSDDGEIFQEKDIDKGYERSGEKMGVGDDEIFQEAIELDFTFKRRDEKPSTFDSDVSVSVGEVDDGHDEEGRNCSDNSITAIATRPSPNRLVPAIMQSFVKFSKMFRNKGLNSPKLYVLNDSVEFDSFFVDFFMNHENYYSSFPILLRSNVDGFCLGEDGYFSRKVRTFHLDDFVIFNTPDFEKLRIEVYDAEDKLQCATSEILLLDDPNKSETLEYISSASESDDVLRKNFIVNMNKQWVGEIYLNNDDFRVVNKALDAVFDIYWRLQQEHSKSILVSQTHVCGNYIEKIKFRPFEGSRDLENSHNDRKRNAKKLLFSSIKKPYNAELILLEKMSNLRGKIVN